MTLRATEAAHDQPAPHRASPAFKDPFRVMAAAAQDAIIMMDEQGRITFWNPAAERMFGHTSDEAMDRNLHQLIAPARFLPAHREAFARWQQTGEGAAVGKTLELAAVRKDGSEFPIELSLSAMQTGGRQVAIGIIRDITERKKVAEALARNEAKYRALFESSCDAIMTLFPPDWKFTSANPATVALFGAKDEKEFTSLGPWQVSPERQPDGELSAEKAKRMIGTAMETGSHFFEWTHRRLSGEIFSATVLLTRVEWEGKTGLQATVRDITEQRRKEEQLRLQDNALRAAANGIAITDITGRIVWVNPGFTRLTGYSAEEAVGQNPRVLKSGCHEDGFYARLWQTITAGRVWHGELINRRKDGSLYTEEMTITPVRGSDGKIAHFIAIKQDVTQRKLVEAELRKARDAAEAAARAKSEFLANMSHEIRTPMNGIIGMTGLLLDTKLTPEQREFAETVRSSADALLTIINDILDFSKIEAGKLAIEPIPCNLRQVTEDVADLMASKAEEKKLDLVVRYGPDVPRRVVADAGRVRQVLTNLVGNAIKFTEKGHVLISVDCDRRSDSHAWLRFSVEDTGIGIPLDRLEGLFERFVQADGSTTRRFGGTGLGLAISKQLVEMMGGGIRARSEQGRGSVFEFTLPLPLDSGPDTTLTPRQVLQGVKVLIVDDNAVNRRVLTENLASFGMKPAAASGGPEALQMLRAAAAAGEPFAIAILDYQMPEMDGEMLGRAIKADAALRNTVLAMLTSLGRRGDAARLRETGFALCLTKPVHFSQLARGLAEVWAGRYDAEPVAEAAEPKRAVAQAAPLHARVLVVEDNITNQKVAARMLEKIGCRVDVAANGREAVRLLQELPYDVVFMDCQMPEMDGYEATGLVRAQTGPNQKVPIIAMTANAMQGDRERCLAAGMDDYVSKPVRVDTLREAVERWATAARRPEAARTDSLSAPPTAGTAGDPPALDPAKIAELRELGGDDGGFLSGLLEVFQKDAAARLAAIRAAIEQADAGGLWQAAHALKGSSANIGARPLAEVCSQLEKLGVGGTVAGAAELIVRAEREMERVEKEITQLRKEVAP